MRVYKTKISGKYRRKVMADGQHAAENGYERRSPYTNCRAEEAWYAGYDEVLKVVITRKFSSTGLFADNNTYLTQFKNWLSKNAYESYTVDNKASLKDMTIAYTFIFNNVADALAFKLKWA